MAANPIVLDGETIALLFEDGAERFIVPPVLVCVDGSPLIDVGEPGQRPVLTCSTPGRMGELVRYLERVAAATLDAGIRSD